MPRSRWIGKTGVHDGQRGSPLIVSFGAYTHHGIDLGDGRVIHYGRGLHNKIEARVEMIPRRDFSGDYPVTVKQETAEFSPDEIVRRAISRLGEDRYDVLENNCEHFVNWCRQGVADSSQINLAAAVCRRGQAAASRFLFPKLASQFVSRVARRTTGRLSMPAALAGDAVQLSAETLAIRAGRDRDRSRDIGRRSGALASGGLGYMLGGPAGAAVGLSSWAFGELLGETTSSTTRRAASQPAPSPDSAP